MIKKYLLMFFKELLGITALEREQSSVKGTVDRLDSLDRWAAIDLGYNQKTRIAIISTSRVKNGDRVHFIDLQPGLPFNDVLERVADAMMRYGVHKENVICDGQPMFKKALKDRL